MMLLGGAVITALSFLLAPLDDPTAQAVRWAVFTFGVVCAAAAVLVLVLSFRRPPARKLLPEGAEYRKKRSLMSPPELRLYRTLCALTDHRRVIVLPQMALAGIVDKISGGGFRNELFRIVDFCIADSLTFEPLLVIELNDASHEREERKLRDDKVSAICDDAGLPLLTLSLAEAADERYVRGELKKRLK